MNDQQLLRYARHIQLAPIDIAGQLHIMHAHILIIGAGGLGSPAALYLAASGVGRLTIVDDDVVSLSNLQRQILFATSDIGQRKVDAAKRALAHINPEVDVHIIAQRADDTLLNTVLTDVDVVLDCTDNFATRHAINRACVALRKPLVSGAAIRFEGQISVFDVRHADSPCYACLFPAQDANVDENCATLGVFAPLVGIIGAMQAAEALKIISQVGQTLNTRLLSLDAQTMNWHCLQLSQNPLCHVCGANAL